MARKLKVGDVCEVIKSYYISEGYKVGGIVKIISQRRAQTKANERRWNVVTISAHARQRLSFRESWLDPDTLTALAYKIQEDDKRRDTGSR